MESEDQLEQREELYVLQRLREFGLDLHSLNELQGLSLSFEQARYLEKLLRKTTRNRIRSFRVEKAISDALPRRPALTQEERRETEREEKELIETLRVAGLEIECAAALLDTRLNKHRAAIGPLVDLFRRFRSPYLKETIARGLADRAARGLAEDALLEEWFRTPLRYENLNYLWTLGFSLSKVATDRSFERIAQILSDQRYARARQELTLFLVRAKDPRAVKVLHELIEDDDMTLHVIEAMKKRKDAKSTVAVEKLRRVCEWDWPFARRCARNLLKKWGDLPQSAPEESSHSE
jgi:hypothetical protein